VAIVQDPADAQFPEMPASAMRAIEVDHVGPAHGIADMIQRYVHQAPPAAPGIPEELVIEAQIAKAGHSSVELQNRPGELTPLTCSDCGGPLWKPRDGSLRFRCLVGHSQLPAPDGAHAAE
jgi:two-component system chemotaxis response regulator CheB